MKFNFILVCLFIYPSVNAQDFILKKQLADRYYERFDFYKAIPMYEQLVKSGPHNFQVYEKLADSYRRINDSKNAERCFAVLMDSSAVEPVYKLFYAQALARNGKYDLSRKWYGRYAEDRPEDTRGHAFEKAYGSMDQFFNDSSSFSIRKVTFNSPGSDFSPMYFRNGVVFVTERHEIGFVNFLYNWTGSTYLDLYFSMHDSAEAVPFSNSINSKFHEGPVTFSPTQDTIIFTRSNYHNLRFGKSSEGINKLKLLQARWSPVSNNWTDISALPFNSDQYSTCHPAFDGKSRILYFISDMPGGYGGTDIYLSRMVTDSLDYIRWSQPENLGAHINTVGNEMFPYVDEMGNLWFSSDGLPGLGGLDLFVANKTHNGFLAPVNLGYPLNSSHDDFGIIMRNGSKGMFTSDRNAEVGNDDIYSFTLEKVILKGVVRDSTNSLQHLENAEVSLCLQDGTIAGIAKTGVDGYFEFPLSLNEDYHIKTSKQGYSSLEKKISTTGLTFTTVNEVIDLTRLKAINLYGTIIDKRTGEKLDGVKIVIIDSLNNRLVLDTTTSKSGYFSKKLNSVKLNDHLGYRIELTKAGYLSRIETFSHRVTSNEINLNSFLEIALDKIEIGTDIGKILNINPIYFDLGKWNIRPDASSELDKIVRAMIDNPNLVIELGSHTDSRGSSQANLVLSDKRAKASAQYIISKGIDKSRIYGKGYGETQLLNRCADDSDCKEEEHSVNRRTEFRIVKF